MLNVGPFERTLRPLVHLTPPKSNAEGYSKYIKLTNNDPIAHLYLKNKCTT